MRPWMPCLAACAVFLLPFTAGADEAPQPAPLKSAKERLSDKASDEQRVDNCRVPLDRRGSKPRPDCPPAQAEGPAPSEKAALPR